MDPTQITSGKKQKMIPWRLPIIGSQDILHDHIVLTVKSHIFYLLFDDGLNSNYYKEDCSDDIGIPGKNSW